MEIIDLKKLNVRGRLKKESKLANINPKMHDLNNHFLLKKIPSSNFFKRGFDSNLLQSPEIMPEMMLATMDVFEQAEKSLGELHNFELKNLDVELFYDGEIKRFNRLLL